jgi:ligand-binding sensor domain-containing protein
MMKNARILLLLLCCMLCLASCASGTGIFSGGDWQAGGLQDKHIHTLTVDPNNPQNIYAGDTQQGVFASTDAGSHWSQYSIGLPLPLTVNALAFDDPGKKLYAATSAGLYVSADGAAHWSAVPGLTPGAYTSIAFDLNNSQVIYVSSSQHGLFISTDDGNSWKAINGGLPGGIIINSLTFDSQTHLLWAATNAGIYRIASGGTNWQSFSTGLPTSTTIYTVLPADTYGGTNNLVFAGTNQGFYLSHDGGNHWTTSQEALSRVSIYTIILDVHQVSTVYIATSGGALRSLDNGQTWGGIGPGLPQGQPVYYLIQGATNYSQLYAATNDVYLYPGTSTPFDLTHLLPLVLVAIFFYLLIRLTWGRRRRSDRYFEQKLAHQREKQGQAEEKKVPDQQ